MQWIGMPEDTDGCFGFVYKITRLNANEGEKNYYIGCKQFSKKIKKKPLKGKKRNRIEFKESDWKEYWGSSEELKKDLELHGKENFIREVLHICSCKWSLKYCECYEQFKHNVLFDETSYNGIQNIRIGKCPKNIRNDPFLPKF